ncbi:hypothetical protein H6F47_19870 [Sphaerospermopsis sp. FACHB-1094]|uniref:hypothetical protein n=1 Tax=Sphaerospermopsis sp. FACHB-1094 TaxID=2692861 RepID=UPI001681F53E|nr:hypothetical protein [Sphaerospermopsis sp. FACHB-1094]MBD2134624.1 hypothetical protein [Sphaerospermopsis sp. FACHB-1094]
MPVPLIQIKCTTAYPKMLKYCGVGILPAILNYQLPITNYQLPITNHQSPFYHFDKSRTCN